MNQIKGIPEYWRKKFQEEGSAMAKQLRYPTFQGTNLRWNEFLEIISKLRY